MTEYKFNVVIYRVLHRILRLLARLRSAGFRYVTAFFRR
jgi:hypothetical protein